MGDKTKSVPEAYDHLWEWFNALAPFADPLSYSEIEAFSRVMRLNIHPREAFILRQLSIIAVQTRQSRNPEVRNQTTMTDAKGLRSLFDREPPSRPGKQQK